MDYVLYGLPKWTTLKWTTPKNTMPNESFDFYRKFLVLYLDSTYCTFLVLSHATSRHNFEI